MTSSPYRSLSPEPGTHRIIVSSYHLPVSVAFVATVAVMVVGAGYGALLGAPSFGGFIGAHNPSADSGQIAPEETRPGCAQPTMATSLLIPNSNPATNVTVGDHVDVTFEFNVSFANVTVAGLAVYTPTVFVTMPTIGGGSFPVTFNNHTFAMTGPHWTSFRYDKLVTNNFTFNPAVNATLSSQKVGTMADTPYGTLTLEWRWSWNITFSNGKYVAGPWTVPTSTTHSGVWLPSIFEPAPYVDLVSESPANDFIGSNYTFFLAGDVASRSFYLELEDPSGVVWAWEWVYDNSTTNATFEANFTLLGHLHYLYPGLYIVHIHDSCIALLYSKRVVLTYPPTAQVQFATTPSNCGTITFNGTAYTNGQSATVTPSPTPYSYSWLACKAYSFSNATFGGAIHVVSQGEMVVSANGTFVVNYHQSAPLITVTAGQGPVGAAVTVAGTDFSPSSTVGLMFDGVTTTICAIGSLLVGGTGSFSCTFTVPNGTSGTSVVATDVGGQTATGTFSVTIPAITVGPRQGPAGATVTTSGTGFSVSSAVGLVFGGETITSCAVGSLIVSGTGSFSCTFTVPNGTSGAAVVATDVGGRTATGTFSVTIPAITVSPKQGPVGATVTVLGVRFSVSSTAELVFDGVVITSCPGGGSLTAVVGAASFSCTFTVPNGTSGASVVATDVGGQTATGTFMVVSGSGPTRSLTAKRGTSSLT